MSKVVIKFWGCRGTLPVPGLKSLKYGGNTNCIELTIGDQHFIFDAGSGIKELSNYLVKTNSFPYQAKIFITHPHYDHINGIPYFVPLYMKGNEFEFFGANQGSITLEQYLSQQMDSVYFPVTMNEFSSSVTFHSLTEGGFDIGDIRIDSILLSHPGRCLGYRVKYKDKIFCYMTDNEIYPRTYTELFSQDEFNRQVEFMKNCNILVIDSTYTDEEYLKKVGWGHSPLSSVIDIADKANVKLLCLYHHDPDQTDDDIDMKLLQAQQMLEERKSATKCIAPHEGEEIIL